MSSEIRMTLMKPDALQGVPDEELLGHMLVEAMMDSMASMHLTPEEVTALAKVQEDPEAQEAAYRRLAGLLFQACHATVAGRAVALHAHDVLVRHAGHRKAVATVLQALNNTSVQGLGGMGGGLAEEHLRGLAACAPLVVQALKDFGLEDDQEEVADGSVMNVLATVGVAFLSNCMGFLKPCCLGECGKDIVGRVAERTVQAYPKDSLAATSCVVFLACTARDAARRGAEDTLRDLEPFAPTVIRLWRLHSTDPNIAGHAAELLRFLHGAHLLSGGDVIDAQALATASPFPVRFLD